MLPLKHEPPQEPMDTSQAVSLSSWEEGTGPGERKRLEGKDAEQRVHHTGTGDLDCAGLLAEGKGTWPLGQPTLTENHGHREQ